MFVVMCGLLFLIIYLTSYRINGKQMQPGEADADGGGSVSSFTLAPMHPDDYKQPVVAFLMEGGKPDALALGSVQNWNHNSGHGKFLSVKHVIAGTEIAPGCVLNLLRLIPEFRDCDNTKPEH